jgi:hypothetical protein
MTMRGGETAYNYEPPMPDARCPPKQAGAEKEDNATAEKRKEGDSDTHRVGHGRIHGGNFYLEER